MKESRDQTIEKLLSLMRKKKEYMENLKILALKQKAALNNYEDMDAEAVLGILEERRSIIDKVDMLDAEVYGKEGPGAARVDFPSEARELEREIARIAREIHDVDKESTAAAEEMMNKLKEKIKEVTLHRKSKDFYKGKGKGFSGVFLNEER
ncbi:MAG: hypothetical protein GX088_05375 [Clostridia bacterium]|nr:hypothetical protein [Clostridia bacterium]